MIVSEIPRQAPEPAACLPGNGLPRKRALQTVYFKLCVN
jgi:hypothetical protein